MTRAKGIPRPAPESGAGPPTARRAAQRDAQPDRLGLGLERDRAGRDALQTAAGSPLRADHRGLNLNTSDAFAVEDGNLRLRRIASWRPNQTTAISGSGADAAINARFAELEARIAVLAQVQRAQGGLE